MKFKIRITIFVDVKFIRNWSRNLIILLFIPSLKRNWILQRINDLRLRILRYPIYFLDNKIIIISIVSIILVEGEEYISISWAINIRSFRTDVEESKEEEEEGEIVTRNRSYSPLSQDLRSQDSGFSDSERSDCSEAYENATPRRKSRRRRLRERRVRSRIASSWSEEVSPPNPMHTSTPKTSKIFQIAKNRLRRRAKCSSQGRRWANRSVESPVSTHRNQLS